VLRGPNNDIPLLAKFGFEYIDKNTGLEKSIFEEGGAPAAELLGPTEVVVNPNHRLIGFAQYSGDALDSIVPIVNTCPCQLTTIQRKQDWPTPIMTSILHWGVTNDVKTQYKSVYRGNDWTGQDCQEFTLTVIDGQGVAFVEANELRLYSTDPNKIG